MRLQCVRPSRLSGRRLDPDSWVRAWLEAMCGFRTSNHVSPNLLSPYAQVILLDLSPGSTV